MSLQDRLRAAKEQRRNDGVQSRITKVSAFAPIPARPAALAPATSPRTPAISPRAPAISSRAPATPSRTPFLFAPASSKTSALFAPIAVKPSAVPAPTPAPCRQPKQAVVKRQRHYRIVESCMEKPDWVVSGSIIDGLFDKLKQVRSFEKCKDAGEIPYSISLDYEALVEKYRPTCIKDLLPNQSKLAAPLFNWLKHGLSKDTTQVPVTLLSGPIGCGKTTIVHLYARALGYDVITVDVTTASSRMTAYGEVSSYAKTTMEKPTIILVDDFDSLCAVSAEVVKSKVSRNPYATSRFSYIVKQLARLRARNVYTWPVIITYSNSASLDVRVLEWMSGAECQKITLYAPPIEDMCSLATSVMVKEGVVMDKDPAAVLGSVDRDIRKVFYMVVSAALCKRLKGLVDIGCSVSMADSEIGWNVFTASRAIIWQRTVGDFGRLTPVDVAKVDLGDVVSTVSRTFLREVLLDNYADSFPAASNTIRSLEDISTVADLYSEVDMLDAGARSCYRTETADMTIEYLLSRGSLSVHHRRDNTMGPPKPVGEMKIRYDKENKASRKQATKANRELKRLENHGAYSRLSFALRMGHAKALVKQDPSQMPAFRKQLCALIKAGLTVEHIGQMVEIYPRLMGRASDWISDLSMIDDKMVEALTGTVVLQQENAKKIKDWKGKKNSVDRHVTVEIGPRRSVKRYYEDDSYINVKSSLVEDIGLTTTTAPALPPRKAHPKRMKRSKRMRVKKEEEEDEGDPMVMGVSASRQRQAAIFAAQLDAEGEAS